jgi:hypothetical protein
MQSAVERNRAFLQMLLINIRRKLNMSNNNFSFLWVAMALTGMAILINYWNFINRYFTSKKEPLVPDEEDTIS